MPSAVTKRSIQQSFLVFAVEHWLDITSGSCLYLELQQQNTNVETLISQLLPYLSREEDLQLEAEDIVKESSVSGKDTRKNFSLLVCVLNKDSHIRSM